MVTKRVWSWAVAQIFSKNKMRTSWSSGRSFLEQRCLQGGRLLQEGGRLHEVAPDSLRSVSAASRCRSAREFLVHREFCGDGPSSVERAQVKRYLLVCSTHATVRTRLRQATREAVAASHTRLRSLPKPLPSHPVLHKFVDSFSTTTCKGSWTSAPPQDCEVTSHGKKGGRHRPR